VNLTTTEARVLYDHLRNLWAPKVPYGDYMDVMRKLEKEATQNRETDHHGKTKP
jgi:hypothetical protein